MKIDTNFIDGLCFILSETNFNKDFLIIYDKKLNKIIPYLPTKEEQYKSEYFQVASINAKDKNKFYVLHRRELPAELFYKEYFISSVVRKATLQTIERNPKTDKDELNLENFFKILQEKFKLNKDQMEALYERGKDYTNNNILDYDKYLATFDYQIDKNDNEFKKFQNSIVYFLFRSSSHPIIKNMDINIRLAMVENINNNKKLIEDIINEKLKDTLKLIELNNKKIKKNTKNIKSLI